MVGDLLKIWRKHLNDILYPFCEGKQMTQTKKQKEYEEYLKEIGRRIFNKRNLKKGFQEYEIKELVENDNFYKPEQIWFTKEMIEADLPRIIKIIKDCIRDNTLKIINEMQSREKSRAKEGIFWKLAELKERLTLISSEAKQNE